MKLPWTKPTITEVPRPEPKTPEEWRARMAELEAEITSLRERCAKLVKKISAPEHPTYRTCKERHPEQLSYDQDDGAICFSDEHPPIRYSAR